MLGFFEKDEVDTELEEQLNQFRGKTWEDYLGQEPLKEKLRIAIAAAKEREERIPHCLFVSGPGQGKTSIAQIMANEYGVELKTYISSAIQNQADIIQICTKAAKNSLIFLDEFHYLSKPVQGILLSVIEDGKITLKAGTNIAHIPLAPFTILAATTDPQKVLEPLRNRFGIYHTLDPYTEEELAKIIGMNSEKIGFPIKDDQVLLQIAKKSRGTPRNCNRLILRIRDFCQIKNNGKVTNEAVEEALSLEGIDEHGLTKKDRQYLETMYNTFGGMPAGVAGLAAAMGEDKSFLENDLEPFLLNNGYITRTSRGRALTQKGIDLLVS